MRLLVVLVLGNVQVRLLSFTAVRVLALLFFIYAFFIKVFVCLDALYHCQLAEWIRIVGLLEIAKPRF